MNKINSIKNHKIQLPNNNKKKKVHCIFIDYVKDYYIN